LVLSAQTGWNANVTTSLPSASVANGIISSTSMAELQFLRVVLGQPSLDAHHVIELHQAHPERDEVLAGGPM
jgi:hypothetical protein